MSGKLTNKIDKIAECILDNKKFNNIGLMGGTSGIALFLFHYSQYFEKEQPSDYACNLIEEIFEKIENGETYPTFAGGLAGLGWLIEHLSQNDFLELDTNETISVLDDFLYQYMINEIKQSNYDYLHNAGGVALYFLSRKSNPQSKKYLEEYVNILAEHSEIDHQSLKWKSEILGKEDERIKVYNLSLSHGMASIVAILSKILKQGINKSKTEQLLKGAINYILSNQFDINKSLSYFPSSITLNGDKGTQSRLAWCYGDLGVSVALWNASKVLKDKELEHKANEILLHASRRRDLKENFVVDAGLCHGTAGIGHIFNRMFINTGIKDFKEASGYWFNETLKMAKFDNGLAGYKVWRTEEMGGWTNDYGFLEGIAGIGLAMLSAVSDTEPTWDESLLLS